MNKELIEQLNAARANQVQARDAADAAMRSITDKVTAEKRDAATDEEKSAFDTAEQARNAARDEITALDARIVELVEQDERDAKAAAVIQRYGTGFGAGTPGVGGAQVTKEPEVYRKYGQRDPNGQPISYFLDLQRSRDNDSEARERLARNTRHVFDNMTPERREQRAVAAGHGTMLERAISTTTGAGGEFVPPLWLEDEWIAFLRPGRIIADKTTKAPLPGGTNSINLPKVNSGTAVAAQGTQNTAIQQTDLTTTSIQSAVTTLAGGQTIAMQLIEQSPLNIDTMILKDLAADYTRLLGVTVVNALIAAGTAQAWTQATPAFPLTGGLYNTILKAVAAMQTTRFAEPNAIFMHPRRWAWALAQVDTNNHPLIVPFAGNGPFNAFGVQDSNPMAQGYVGQIGGYPVYTDPNIPTNAGAGTNQDYIFVAKTDDVYLWEGNVRTEAFAQTYAQNLSLFVRLYNYISVQAAKYASAVQVITGTGAVTPAY